MIMPELTEQASSEESLPETGMIGASDLFPVSTTANEESDRPLVMRSILRLAQAIAARQLLLPKRLRAYAATIRSFLKMPISNCSTSSTSGI
mgnify:CR=1 FL=1